MKIIFVLIILAVILLCVAVIVFFWAVKQRQFDDLDVHAYSVLKEDNYEAVPEENIDVNPRNELEKTSATNSAKALGKRE